MKILLVIAVLAITANEAAAACGGMVCNNNPTCQQLRNAGKCDVARAAGGAAGSAARVSSGNCSAYRKMQERANRA